MTITYLNVSGQMGGNETSLLELLAGVQATQPGWNLNMILGAPGPFAAKVAALQIPTHILPFPPVLAALGDSQVAAGPNYTEKLRKALHLTLALPKARSYIKALSHLLHSLKPDLIHASGLKMHVLGAWANPPGTPLIWHVQDYVGSRPVMRRLLNWNSHRCSTIIADSKSVQRDLERCCPQHRNIISVYNAVDLDRFSPRGPKMDLDVASGLSPAPSGTVRIGLLAAFAKWKGHSLFLEALSRLPAQLQIRSYIIGGPIYQTQGSQHTLADLQAEVKRLGLEGRVGFTNSVEAPESALRSLDIVVHASTQPEPFGMVIVEAMACGKAVIASRSSGASEVFSEGHDALAYTCGDSRELAQHLATLLADPVRRANIAAAGRQSVQKLHRSRLASELAEIYHRALNSAVPMASL